MAASNDRPAGRKPQSEPTAAGASIDPADVARFSAIAATWWDPKGPFAPLHKFNPARLDVLRREALARFGRDPRAIRPFEGLSLLDVGCGGGLLSEPMRRMGFAVTGVDASEKNIGTARQHAVEQGLDITYRAATVEQLAAEGAGPFDVVLNMEVVEHVADPKQFLLDSASLVKPGGLMVVATLNRTLRSLALAKIGAEYILRWLPAGTHDWRQFLKPEEIRRMLHDAPVRVEGPLGLSYNPLTDRWSETDDDGINYMMLAFRD